MEYPNVWPLGRTIVFLAIAFISGYRFTAITQQSVPSNTSSGSSIGDTTPGGQVGKADDKIQPSSPDSRGTKSNEPEVLGLVGALAGAVIGGIIGWRASLSAVNKAQELAKQSEQLQEEKENRAVRAMLSIEIDENLAMLREEATRVDIDTRPQDRSGIEWVAAHPLPKWSTAVWNRTVLLVYRTLSIEEISAIQILYVSLQSLTVAREELSRVFLRQKSHHDVEVFYHRAMDLTNSVLEAGNPLKKPISANGPPAKA